MQRRQMIMEAPADRAAGGLGDLKLLLRPPAVVAEAIFRWGCGRVAADDHRPGSGAAGRSDFAMIPPSYDMDGLKRARPRGPLIAGA